MWYIFNSDRLAQLIPFRRNTYPHFESQYLEHILLGRIKGPHTMPCSATPPRTFAISIFICSLSRNVWPPVLPTSPSPFLLSDCLYEWGVDWPAYLPRQCCSISAGRYDVDPSTFLCLLRARCSTSYDDLTHTI